MRSPSRRYRAATNDTAAIMTSCRKARRARRLLGKIVAFPLVIGFLYSNRAARETSRVATVPFSHDIGAAVIVDVRELLGRQPDLARIIHEEADRRLAAGWRARRRAARNNVAGSPRPRG